MAMERGNAVLIACLGLSALSAAWAGPLSERNLCYNGTFDAPGNPLDGWMIDYAWTGHSTYKSNASRVSAVAAHKGRRDVLFINGTAETKVESRAIPFEQGARYRCTLEMQGNTTPHIYFTGYKWKPGIRPYENPHLGDLRRIYKSQFRNHKVKSSSGGWKRVTFEFPLQNPSRLAKKHLKYLRFFTVYIIVITDAKGQVYVDNVRVTKIR
jgi:hypothetical protein